jgi:uncharacterized BrkB/YihY/UPF0761 family membrane protein
VADEGEAGAVGRAKRLAADLGRRAQRAWDAVEERSAPARFGRELWARYQRTNVSLLLGSLAYRLFLFIIPMTLVIVALVGQQASSGVDVEDDIGEKMRLGQALAHSLSQAGSDTGGGWRVALTVGLTGVLLTGWSLFGALFSAYAQVWEIPRTMMKKRFSSGMRFVGGLVVFMLVIYAMAWVRRHGPLLGVAGGLVVVAIALGLFLALSIVLPHKGDDWRQLVPGALASGAGTIALQLFSATVLPNQVAHRSQTYGALGIALALFTYLAFLSFILLLAPLINATWAAYVDERGDDAGLLAAVDRVTEKAKSMARRGDAPSDSGPEVEAER